MCVCRCLLWKGSPDDAVNLFVEVQPGKTAALGVVGHADGYRLGALCNRHCNLKKLKGKQITGGNEQQHLIEPEKRTGNLMGIFFFFPPFIMDEKNRVHAECPNWFSGGASPAIMILFA